MKKLLLITLSLLSYYVYSQTRPYYPVTSNSGTITTANNLLKYTEEQWLQLVPTQAPRTLQFSPADVNNSTWTWSADTPNQITCTTTGTVFPNAAYIVSYAQTKVMTGKIVNVPYYNTTKGVTYVQAEIDHQKTTFLTTNLPILGAAYQLTKDERYARYVALALDKWANAVPDFFMTEAWNKSKLVGLDQLSTYRNTINFVQRASAMNGLVRELHDGQIMAFDRIYESNALLTLSIERGYDVRQHISNDFFLNIALWLKDQPTMESHAGTNLVGHIGCMIKVAAVCADSVLKASIIDFVDRYFTVVIGRNFKRDGMYPESFAYHRGYADTNYANIQLMENYFTLFPPTTPDMNAIFSRLAFKKAFTNRTTLVHDSVAFPNGDLAPFDDTNAGYGVVRTSTKSYLLPAYSHAMLGAGSAFQQIQSNIGANDKANHVGNSMMGMTLYAFGKELIGDIRYSRIPGRVFTNSVQAHNLVAIDQVQTQYYSHKRLEYGNDGHVFTNGYFTMFEPDLNGVAATEVYSNTTSPGLVTRYQRLQVLNTISLARPYLIDVFVVNGGKTHDYILNGSTQIDQTATSSLPLVNINATYPLLPAGATYTDPIFESDDTNWYGAFRNVSSAKSTGNWNVTFQNPSNAGGVKIFAVDDATPTIYLGTSPYPTRRTTATSLYAYWRPALIERRIGATTTSKSVFIHVIEPYSSSSQILSVTKLPLTSTSDEFVALSIEFTDGRKDVALINLNSDLITAKAPTQTITTSDSKFSLTGKIGLFSEVNSTMTGYLILGSKLKYGSQTIDIQNPVYTGNITKVLRIAAGDAYNAFEVSTSIPEGDELKGKWISVRYGTYTVINPPSTIKTQSNMNELFQIVGVKTINGKSHILCKEDPQLQINGTVTTELMRPQRVFNGTTTFGIVKSRSADLGTTINTITPEIKQKLIVYPNPAKDQVFLQSDTDIDTIEILSIEGVVLKSVQNVTGLSTMKIATNELSDGIYLLKSVDSYQKATLSRLIISRSEGRK